MRMVIVVAALALAGCGIQDVDEASRKASDEANAIVDAGQEAGIDVVDLTPEQRAYAERICAVEALAPIVRPLVESMFGVDLPDGATSDICALVRKLDDGPEAAE